MEHFSLTFTLMVFFLDGQMLFFLYEMEVFLLIHFSHYLEKAPQLPSARACVHKHVVNLLSQSASRQATRERCAAPAVLRSELVCGNIVALTKGRAERLLYGCGGMSEHS